MPLLPRHLEFAQVRQVLQDHEPAIGQFAAGYSLRFRSCNCGMGASCCSPSSVSSRDPPRLSAVT